MKRRMWQGRYVLVALMLVVPMSNASSPESGVVSAGSDGFEGYDFEQVVQRVETSVDALQQEMAGSFQAFSDSLETAERLLGEDKPEEAVAVCATAIEQVVTAREKVLEPMWEGQAYLGEQTTNVRARLAKAVEASGGSAETRLGESAEAMLDGIAKRVGEETDGRRKKRLVAHYRTIRQLAQIRQMSRQLSPNQRKLWKSVLHVLEDTALAHQQVLMGTEVLFAQFEATAANLRDYRELIRTVDGAAELLGVARGLGQSGAGLGMLSKSMYGLQKRVGGLNGQIEEMLQIKMFDLEAQVESVNAIADAEAGAVPVAIDDELSERLARVSGNEHNTRKGG